MEDQPTQQPTQQLERLQLSPPPKSHKKLIIVIIIVLVALLIAAGVFVAIRFLGTHQTDAGISRGIKPDDKFQFKDAGTIKGIPALADSKALGDGWKQSDQATAAGSATIYSYTQQSTSCTLMIQSGTLPYGTSSKKDFELSKQFTESLAGTGQSTLSDVYVIEVPSTRGTLQFYTGVYEPKIVLSHPEGTQPTTMGGNRNISGTKTFVAGRVINQEVSGSSTQDIQKEGVIGLSALVPAISATYTCPEKSFDPLQAIKALDQLTIDLESTTVPQASTTGK